MVGRASSFFFFSSHLGRAGGSETWRNNIRLPIERAPNGIEPMRLRTGG